MESRLKPLPQEYTYTCYTGFLKVKSHGFAKAKNAHFLVAIVWKANNTPSPLRERAGVRVKTRY